MQTGGGPTGKFWAHEHFNLDPPPDLVTFSKKMLIGGYFYRAAFRPDQPYRIFNTWLGDPSKLVLLEAAVKFIKQQNLVENISKVGDHLLNELKSIEKRYSNVVMNARGRGTFCAIDFKTPELRDKAIKILHQNGIHCGGSGSNTLRIRTTLTFNKKHVEIFIDRLDKTLSKMN